MNYKSYKALNIAANAAGLSVVLFFAVEKGTGRISAITPQLRIACGIVLFALSIALLIFTIRARSLYRRNVGQLRSLFLHISGNIYDRYSGQWTF